MRFLGRGGGGGGGIAPKMAVRFPLVSTRATIIAVLVCGLSCLSAIGSNVLAICASSAEVVEVVEEHTLR